MQRSILNASVLIAALFAGILPGMAGEEPKGDIEWVRDMDAAVKLAQDTGRPLIAYFTFDT